MRKHRVDHATRRGRAARGCSGLGSCQPERSGKSPDRRVRASPADPMSAGLETRTRTRPSGPALQCGSTAGAALRANQDRDPPGATLHAEATLHAGATLHARPPRTGPEPPSEAPEPSRGRWRCSQRATEHRCTRVGAPQLTMNPTSRAETLPPAGSSSTPFSASERGGALPTVETNSRRLRPPSA